MTPNNGSLVIVGSGIKLISHLTIETIAYIKQSDIVLYSLNEPIIEDWVKENNSNSKSLNFLEDEYNLRTDLYEAITDFILIEVKKSQHVCVLFYGHPIVFAKSALNAAIKAKQDGYYTKILPAISAEDCLFADLSIDPGSHGCLSYEATDFLIRKKHIDTTCHVILWQIGLIGLTRNKKHNIKHIGGTILYDQLVKYYPKDHSVIIYEAALYPHIEPKIVNFFLYQLTNMTFTSLSTLYIPPTHQAKLKEKTLKRLNISVNELAKG